MSNPEKSWRGHLTDLSTSPVKCSRFTFTDKYVLRRSASGGRTDSTCAARHTPTLNAVVCRCELDDCSERVQTSNFLSATVLSCRKSNSYRRSGRDTDKTVLSCPAWRCELTLKQCISSVHLRQLIIVIIWYFAPPPSNFTPSCILCPQSYQTNASAAGQSVLRCISTGYKPGEACSGGGSLGLGQCLTLPRNRHGKTMIELISLSLSICLAVFAIPHHVTQSRTVGAYGLPPIARPITRPH